MKNFKCLFVILFVFLNTCLISQTRPLDPNTSYTWYYNDSVPTNGVVDANGNFYTDTQVRSMVRTAIQNAFSAYVTFSERSGIWSFTETSSYSSADFRFYFVEQETYGSASGLPNVTFDNTPGDDGTKKWTTSSYYWENYDYPLLAPNIAHEIGHIFGLGHGTGVMEQPPSTTTVSTSDRAELADLYNPDFTINIELSFGAGDVQIDDADSSPQTLPVASGGSNFIRSEKEFPVEITAIEQEINNYMQRFNVFSPSGLDGNSSGLSFTVSSADGGYLDIDYLKEFDIDFTNNHNTNIRVNSSTYTTPTQDFPVVETYSIQAEVMMKTDCPYTGITSYFDHWNDNSSTTNPRTFYPSNHTTYTSTSYGVASTSSMNVQFVGDPGDHITIDWDDHVSTDVTQYKVWRYPSTLLATLNRGTTTYTDRSNTFYDGSGTAINLHYAVTAYYSPDNTWSTQNWKNILGDDVPWNIKEEPIEEKSEELALVVVEEKELSLANHPNPFNPETIINYTNPENSLVTIKVYDMLGREVRTLVNEVKDAGNYSVRFNAGGMPSGVYIYTIATNKSTLSKKMILMK